MACKLASLRLSTPDETVPADVVAEIGAHLIVRAAHFRDVFRMFVTAIINTITKLRADPEFAKALIGFGKPEGDQFREMVRAKLSEQKDMPPEIAKRLEDAIHRFFGEFIEIRALMRARVATPIPADFENQVTQAQ